MLRFSIVTCVKNAESTISKCLASVDSLNHRNFEHIIFDGKSTDNTLSIIQERKKKYRRVITQCDAGLYDALNKAVRMAKGQYIILLHADDVLFGPTILNELDAFLEDTIFPDIVCCNIQMNDQIGNIVRRWDARAFKWIGIENGWCPPHTGLVLSRQIYNEFLPYAERYSIAADYDFIVRLLKKYTEYSFFDEYLVKMSTGGMSTSTKNFKRMLWEDIKVTRSHRLHFWAPLLKRTIKVGQLF